MAGQPNLYLDEAGTLRFIATLAEADLTPPRYSPVATELRFRIARVSPDGGAAAFMSVAPLTGYENTDRRSGEADTEVFLYRAAADEGAGALLCASCNPSGARPAGTRSSRRQGRPSRPPPSCSPPRASSTPRGCSPKTASRLYFESYDALALADTNGSRDVYQWEQAGAGTCTAASPSYSPANGGCVDLISSGRSAGDSGFVDASPSGADVFFTTASSLLPQDPGLVDVYDARAGGGLPAPEGAPPSCEGESCQPSPQAPGARTPASSAFHGPGNVSEAASPFARCNAAGHRAGAYAKRAKALRRNAKKAAPRNPRRAAAMRRKAARYARAARKQSGHARRCRARVRKARR